MVLLNLAQSEIFIYIFTFIFFIISMGFGIRHIYISCTQKYREFLTKYEPHTVWSVWGGRCLHFMVGLVGVGMAVFSIFHAREWLENINQFNQN